MNSVIFQNENENQRIRERRRATTATKIYSQIQGMVTGEINGENGDDIKPLKITRSI